MTCRNWILNSKNLIITRHCKAFW